MTLPQVRSHTYKGITLTWEQAGVYVPVISVDDIAASLNVEVAVLVKDFTHSGSRFNNLYPSDAGEPCFEFDSLWDYLKVDCPFEGAKDLWSELFGCEL